MVWNGSLKRFLTFVKKKQKKTFAVSQAIKREKSHDLIAGFCCSSDDRIAALAMNVVCQCVALMKALGSVLTDQLTHLTRPWGSNELKLLTQFRSMCRGTHVACIVRKDLCHCAAWHALAQRHAHVQRHRYTLSNVKNNTRSQVFSRAQTLLSRHQRAVFSSRSQTICLFPPLNFSFPEECNFLRAAECLTFHVCAHVLCGANTSVLGRKCQGDLFGQDPAVVYQRDVTQHQQFSMKKQKQQQKGFSVVLDTAAFFPCFSCLTSVPSELFAIKGVYYGCKNHHRQSVSHNGTYTLWYACKIICTVTPSRQGVMNKTIFLLFYSRWFLLLQAGCICCVTPIRLIMTPRSQCIATAVFSSTEKKPYLCVCCDQLGLLWWMGCKAWSKLSAM